MASEWDDLKVTAERTGSGHAYGCLGCARCTLHSASLALVPDTGGDQ